MKIRPDKEILQNREYLTTYSPPKAIIGVEIKEKKIQKDLFSGI